MIVVARLTIPHTDVPVYVKMDGAIHRLALAVALREAIAIAQAYKNLLDTGDYYNDTVDARLRALTGEKGGA